MDSEQFYFDVIALLDRGAATFHQFMQSLREMRRNYRRGRIKLDGRNIEVRWGIGKVVITFVKVDKVNETVKIVEYWNGAIRQTSQPTILQQV